MALRIIFFGSAELSCPVLHHLAQEARFRVVGVVTQPDRPFGRRLELRPSPVRLAAAALGVPTVLTPEQVNAPESIAALEHLKPDLFAVVAYGQFFGRRLLALPPRACVNLHTSLLPKYRGAAPIQWAIANGETHTGVTTMLMNAGMDAGDVLLQREMAIKPGDTGGTLHDRMAVLGADLLVETLLRWVDGDLRPVPQDAAAATYAAKLKKADGRIDWSLPATVLHNRVRAFNPWPCCFFDCEVADGGTTPPAVRVLETAVEPLEGETPGTVLRADAGGPLVATGSGALRLVRVQPPGGRVMSGAAYGLGHAMGVGRRLPV